MTTIGELQLLDTAQVAELLGISRRTLESWRRLGCGPRFIRCGRAARYREADLLDFLTSHARTTTRGERPRLSVVGTTPCS